MNHTPGPWRRFGCTIYRENQRVADTWNPESPFLPDIAISNARLIASAPELLAALELIHSNAGESPEWIRERIAPAIAKAKGGAL